MSVPTPPSDFVLSRFQVAMLSVVVLIAGLAPSAHAQSSASSSDRTNTTAPNGPTQAPQSYTSFSNRLRGPVGELRLSSVKPSIPADGVSSSDIVLRVLDASGAPLTQEVEITLEINAGARIQVPGQMTSQAGVDAVDSNAIVPAAQVRVKGGTFGFKVIAPMQPGEISLRASIGGREVTLALSAVPDAREMFAVGLIEMQIRSDKFDSAKILPARENDGLDQELRAWRREFGNGRGSVSGRAAVYLKGLVAGDYLLTLSYDSEKPELRKLFQDIDPNLLYPVYGDSSVKGVDAQSTSRLYVRLDKAKSWIQYGDLTSSNLGGNALASYSRSLTGLKAHYEVGSVAVEAFVSRDSLRQIVDEFPGRGISGPYGLSNPNGVQGSEKVELVVRDRNQPTVILKATPLVRFSDYEFEPFSGRILFKSPVPSVDENLNPVSIRITYEVDQGGQSFTVAGAEVKLKLSERVAVGASVAKDANPTTPFRVAGAYVDADLTKSTKLKVELARSDGTSNNGASSPSASAVDQSGSAVKLELTHSADNLRARIFGIKAQDGFNNPNSGITSGRTEFGAQAALKLSEQIAIKADLRKSEDSTSDRKADGVSLGVEYKPNRQLSVELGVRRAEQNANALQQTGNIACNGTVTPAGAANPGFGINPLGGQTIDQTTGLPVICNNASVAQGVSNTKTENDNLYLRGRYELSEKLAVNAEISRDTAKESTSGVASNKSNASLYSLGLEYQPYEKTRIYLRHDQSRSLTGLFGLGGGDTVGLTTLGIDTEYMTDGQLFSEYRLRDSLSGRDVQNAVGLRNTWTVAQGLKLQTNAEILRTAASTSSTGVLTAGNITKAFGVGLEYTDSPLWKGSTRFEVRDDSSSRSILFTAGYTAKLSRDWNLIARQYLNTTKPDVGGKSSQDRLQLGIAYRPVDNNQLDIIGLAEAKREVNDTLSSSINRSANILSTRISYHPSRPWWVSGRFAYKQVKESLLGVRDNYSANLLSGRVTYDVSNRWSVGLHLSSLQGRDARQYAYGIETGYTVVDNFLVVLGYTWRGFSDTDLAPENYTNKGWYIGLRYKFDEDLFNSKLPSVNRTLTPSSGEKK